jgi:hypothetical protein
MDLFEEQIQISLSQLAASEKMPVRTRVPILGTLARTHRSVQEAKIEAHLKTPHAQILARLVRRYRPDATDEEIIIIVREEIDAWKASV